MLASGPREPSSGPLRTLVHPHPSVLGAAVSFRPIVAWNVYFHPVTFRLSLTCIRDVPPRSAIQPGLVFSIFLWLSLYRIVLSENRERFTSS